MRGTTNYISDSNSEARYLVEEELERQGLGIIASRKHPGSLTGSQWTWGEINNNLYIGTYLPMSINLSSRSGPGQEHGSETTPTGKWQRIAASVEQSSPGTRGEIRNNLCILTDTDFKLSSSFDSTTGQGRGQGHHEQTTAIYTAINVAVSQSCEQWTRGELTNTHGSCRPRNPDRVTAENEQPQSHGIETGQQNDGKTTARITAFSGHRAVN